MDANQSQTCAALAGPALKGRSIKSGLRVAIVVRGERRWVRVSQLANFDIPNEPWEAEAGGPAEAAGEDYDEEQEADDGDGAGGGGAPDWHIDARSWSDDLEDRVLEATVRAQGPFVEGQFGGTGHHIDDFGNPGGVMIVYVPTDYPEDGNLPPLRMTAGVPLGPAWVDNAGHAHVIIAGPTGTENPGGTRVQLTLDPARYVTAADLHVIRDTLRRLRPGMWGIDDSTLARPDLSDEHEAAVGDLAQAAKKPKGKGKRRFDGGGGGGPAAKQPRTLKPSPFKRPAPLAAAARAGPESAFKRARTSVQVGGGGRCGGGGGGGSAGGSDWGYGMSRFFMDQREQQLELARQQEELAREQREFQANVLALLQNMQASLAQRAQVDGLAQQLAALQNMLYPEAADNAAQEGAEAGAADAEAEHQDEEEDEGYSA
ncbi:hypothetical protein JKP88DRAFT_314741 [Tribonema minus]|uniref:Uncharacterized protein n=1 Tax=Tribonema minus TaxID=303371 RepID=A0A835YZ49_9STRA|nr:hypothetical protein JKP88DRAFT_314741 [Tribonema minus]